MKVHVITGLAACCPAITIAPDTSLHVSHAPRVLGYAANNRTAFALHHDRPDYRARAAEKRKQEVLASWARQEAEATRGRK